MTPSWTPVWFEGPTLEKRKRRILVVDDERTIAETLAAIVTKYGFEVSTAYNGFLALESALSFQPDLLLSDVILPELNGIELAKGVQKAIPSCKVLLFSGQLATVELLAAAAAEGLVFEILAKPTPPAELMLKIQKIFAEANAPE